MRSQRSLLACLVSIFCLSGSLAQGQGLGVVGDLIGLEDGSRVLLVRTVDPQGLASRLGVFPGDQILSINRFAPGDAAVNERLIALGAGELAIVVNRQGTRLQLGDRLGQPSGPGFFDDYRNAYGPRLFRVPLENPPAERATLRKGPDLLVDLEQVQDLSGTRVRIRSVTPGGRGSREGLRPGDIVDSVNGWKVRTVRDVREAYVFRNGQITITVLRRDNTFRITLLDQDSTRKTLGLTCIMTQQREIKVTGADPKGLGSEMGIANRGTVISKVNGSPIRTPGDMKSVDQAIIDGRINQLEIEFTPPGGQPQIVRRRL